MIGSKLTFFFGSAESLLYSQSFYLGELYVYFLPPLKLRYPKYSLLT